MNKTVRLGINGFGRIGRLITRISQDFDNVEVVAINDPFLTPDYAKYLLERDSMHGNFKGTVEQEGDTLVVNGKPVKFFAVMNPEEIDWKSAGVDYVVECTGKFTTIEGASKHLVGGAKRVIIARELNKEQIKEIINNTPKGLELEMFAHGAICFGYSGRCFLSEYLSGRNANLGDCAQSCRWSYNLYAEEKNNPGELMPIEIDKYGTSI